jgi:NDP-sugar pyrophosphorylase family protein
MQTIILAGGKGTRLKPYTTVLPKPLMPIGDVPILEIVLRQLKFFGCKKVIMAVGHLKELLMAFFNSGQKWGLEIKYSFEEKPLGTAGPLKLINGEDIEDNFIVMNGDVLTDLDYRDFFDFHKKNDALCTIATYKKPVKINLGVLELKDDVLTNYIEKPTLNYTVSMGVYAFKKETLSYIPFNEYFDFPDLIKKLIKENKKVLSYQFDNFWLDIGTPSDFEIATETFENNKHIFLKDL